ncbi:interferon-induced protein 44-like protein [Lates japonicus]|uniref:Interferon-induced protein 44-like protein n=2 Tax=Lates japonicus TaxID=270547 RepID=A0AAD3NJZ9_LATJO|nr:interferon-induced protein 44-like protein [Lates japonicus]
MDQHLNFIPEELRALFPSDLLKAKRLVEDYIQRTHNTNLHDFFSLLKDFVITVKKKRDSHTEHLVKYETHKIRKGRDTPKTFYPFVFNDMMGLENGSDSGVPPDDIKLAMKGHVKEGHTFNHLEPLTDRDPGYNPAPSLQDKVHVLVCVISANSPEITLSLLQKMKKVKDMARDLGIPQMAVMTSIDLACSETEKDLKNVYRSRHLKQKMSDFSSAVGIPMNCIFPVKNYSEEIDLDDDVDTLILSALRHMLDFGDDFIDKLKP